MKMVKEYLYYKCFNLVHFPSFFFDIVKVYNPLDFSNLVCPNLRRLRLSGLSLPSPSSSPSFSKLFECLNSEQTPYLRHLQLELRLEQARQEVKEKKEESGADAYLHSTSLQRLSVDNYYADYFFNVSLDCPNLTSMYLFHHFKLHIKNIYLIIE